MNDIKKLGKLPEITLLFWVMKICATTLGETAGDLLSMTLTMGYAVSSVILFGAFLASLAGQLRSTAYHPLLYWTVILTTSTAGTTMSDFIDRSLGIGYAGGSVLLVGLLLTTLFFWWKSEKSLSVTGISTRRGELFYWTAILFSNTLGTALGDFLADDSGLGFAGGALLIGGLLVLVVLAFYFTKISRVALFWAAFVLTRPFGATFGDLLTKPLEKGGLGFGTVGSSLVLFGVLAALIFWILRTNKKALLALASLLFFFGTKSVSAQTNSVTLSGKMQDAQTKAPLAFLSVILKTEKDSVFVARALTDDAGAFVFSNLKKGYYLLEATFLGYQKLRQRVLVGELSPFLDLGILQVREDAKMLGEVVVSAKANAVSGKMDKKTFAVADNISQSGGSVVQAMSNLPGVTLGEGGKIELRGSDKVAILIDGKQTALTGYGSQTGLENMPASALERIEIINNPSAKYDANASAGIINLVFKKEEKRGFNGKIGMTAGAGALWEKRENLPTIRPQYRWTPKVNPSFSVNYRKRATNFFVQGDWLFAPTLNKNEFSTRFYDDGTVLAQQVKRNRRTDYSTAKTGLDHDFGKGNSLSVSGLFNREKILDNGDQPFFAGSAEAQNRYRLWQFLEDEVKYTAFGAAVFTHKFRQPGHSLTATANYSFHREDEKYFFTNTTPQFTSKDSFALLSDEHVYDLNLDYAKPLRQGRVEAGFKGRFRSIPVNMRFFPGLNSPLDTAAGGWADYFEKIPAVYSNYVFENEKVEIEGGLRVEFVQVDYKVNPNHNTYKSDGYQYFQPFPNLRAAYKLNDNNKITLFLNHRVDRPNEVDIRIFPKYDEPELVKVGNPALRPQFTVSAELGFKNTFSSGSFFAAVYHRIIDGTITRIAAQAPGSVILYNVFQNVGRSWNTGAEFVWQQKVSKMWSLSANANVYENRFAGFSVVNRYPVPTTFSAEKQQLISGNFKFSGSLKTPENFESQVSAIWLAPDLLPQGRIGSRFGLDVGLKKTVQKGRGEWVLNATDLFNTMQIRRTINGAGFRIESTDFYETQVVRAGYHWKF